METSQPLPPADICFRGDKELNLKFIELKGSAKFRKMFNGAKNSANQGYAELLKDLGYVATLKNIKTCIKRWDKLNQDYKLAKAPQSGSGSSNGELSRTSFQYMQEMEAATGSNHNIDPPILVAGTDNKGLESSDEEAVDLNSSNPVCKKKRKLISSPDKQKEKKKKRASMSSIIEDSLAKSDEVSFELVEMIKHDVKERRKDRKAAARQSKSLLKILAAGVLIKRPGGEEEAAEMAKSAVDGGSSSESD